MLVAALAIAADASALTVTEDGPTPHLIPHLELSGVTLGGQGQPPAAGLPRLEVPPIAPEPPEAPRTPPLSPSPQSPGQAPPPGGGQQGSGPSGPSGPAPVASAPAPSAPSVVRASARALLAPPADPAVGPHARGSGGTAAAVPTVARPSEDAARIAPSRRRGRPERVPARSAQQGFALLAAAARPREVAVAVAGRSRPGGVEAALASLRGESADGTLAWILALVAGTVVIAAMCADALGVGPRHDYLRRARRSPGRWPRWR